MPSLAAGQGVVVYYTIHVDFFAFSCNLNIRQVDIYDSYGNLVGTGSSPVGGEVAITIRATIPISAITATAYGVATWGSYLTWQVNGSRTITLGSPGDYWVTIKMSS